MRFVRVAPGPTTSAVSLLLYGVLAVLIFWTGRPPPPITSIGFGPDARLFMWDLGWMPFALSHGLNPLLTNYLDYPGGINLLWSNPAPLLATLWWPLTMSHGVVVGYDVAVTAGVAISAWSAFLLIGRFIPNPIAAFLGGLVYGFSPFTLAHALGQLHLVVAVFPPLILLILYEVLIVQRLPALPMGVLLGLVATAQLLTSEEVLATTAFTSLLILILLAALYPEQVGPRTRSAAVALAAAAATTLVLSAGPLAVQFLGPQHVGKPVNPTGFYASDLLGFLVPGPLEWLAPAPAKALASRFTGNPAEWHAYLGLPLLAVMGYTAVRLWRRPPVKVAALLALMLALLSLGPTLHVAGVISAIPVGVFAVLFILLRKIAPAKALIGAFLGSWVALAVAPVLSNAWPGRLMLYVFLFAGILLAVFVDLMLASSGWARAAALVACGAVILTLAPALPFPSSRVPVPTFFTTTVRDRVPEGSVVLVAPYAYGWDNQAMVWQAASGMWFRMPEGYGTVPGPSVNPPPTALSEMMMRIDQGFPYGGLSDSARRQLGQDLARWHVQTVVVGPMEHEDVMVSLFSDLLRQEPEYTGGVYLWGPVGPSLSWSAG